MPQTLMDYLGVSGVVAAWLAVFVGCLGVWAAFKHRPKKTTNFAVGSDRVDQRGGEGTTTNTAKTSRDVRQQG